MTEQTVFVFDLGEHVGSLIDAEKMQDAVGQPLTVRWGSEDVPGRILSMSKSAGRLMVTVGIDAPIDGLDLGVPPCSIS